MNVGDLNAILRSFGTGNVSLLHQIFSQHSKLSWRDFAVFLKNIQAPDHSIFVDELDCVFSRHVLMTSRLAGENLNIKILQFTKKSLKHDWLTVKETLFLVTFSLSISMTQWNPRRRYSFMEILKSRGISTKKPRPLSSLENLLASFL